MKPHVCSGVVMELADVEKAALSSLKVHGNWRGGKGKMLPGEQ